MTKPHEPIHSARNTAGVWLESGDSLEPSRLTVLFVFSPRQSMGHGLFNVGEWSPAEVQMCSRFQKCLEPRRHFLKKERQRHQAINLKLVSAWGAVSWGQWNVGLSHEIRILTFQRHACETTLNDETQTRNQVTWTNPYNEACYSNCEAHSS